MKPLKSLGIISRWFLRTSILLFVIALFFPIAKQINFNHLSVYVLLAFIYCLFGILLFIGGFHKNSSLTVISSLIVFLISVYFIVSNYGASILDFKFIIYMFPLSISLFFMANGNN